MNLQDIRREQVAREDLVLFINACFACTGQKEFYSDGWRQRVSIDFLHRYILGNYRLLYARTLAAGINDFNAAQIIVNLLSTGRSVDPAHRVEEGALIAAALRRMPPQRAWRVLSTLRERKINNRRARAIVREYAGSRDIVFDSVKYRVKVRSALRHTHDTKATSPQPPPPEGERRDYGELGAFLFRGWKERAFKTPLYESFRAAHFSASSIYKLPFTVAEGLAAKHGIDRKVFLQGIEAQMTEGEKLRMQRSAEESKSKAPAVDWDRLPLTKLTLYALSLTPEQRVIEQERLLSALMSAAHSSLRRSPMRLGKVAAVLDNSYSSFGSSEKRRRPLAVAIAADYLLRTASTEYRAFWSTPTDDPLSTRAHGQTDLSTPILDALDWGPDLVVIVSDGCDNDPPHGAGEVLRVFRSKLDPGHVVSIVHCNPVFDPEDYLLKSVSPFVPTVGLRDAEDLSTMLGFARFADGSESLAELEAYLAARSAGLIAAMEKRSRREVEI